MKWAIASESELVRYFELENIWSKKWERVIGGRASVLSHDGSYLNLSVWEAMFNGKKKRFAADEVSNNVWVFALPPH